MTEALAIILARAGSKGLPGKNRAEVAGRPCALWTIDAALEAETVARIGLSSDDPELLDVARRAGIETWTRPAPLAGDTATVDAAARHALRSAEGGARLPDDHPVVLLYANVPVRPPGLIDRAVRLLVEAGCDSVQSFAAVGKFHPWWMVRIGDDGRIGPWEGDELFHGVYRRQNLPPAHVPDGGVIALTRRALTLQSGQRRAGRASEPAGDDLPQRAVPEGPGPHAFLGLDRRAITTAPGDVIDIDTPTDLLVAEAALRQRAGVPL
jgi:CMP-N,N'-diacetyllegionaminic acid synthase